MDRLSITVLILAVILLIVSVFLIINFGIPALETLNSPSNSAPVMQSAAASPGAGNDTGQAMTPIPTVVAQNPPALEDDPEIKAAVENLFRASDFGLSEADAQILGDGVSATLNAGSARINFRTDGAIAGISIDPMTIFDFTGTLTIASPSINDINLQFDTSGVAGIGTVNNYDVQLRSIGENLYFYLAGLPDNPLAGQWWVMNLDNMFAQATGMPVGVIPFAPGMPAMGDGGAQIDPGMAADGVEDILNGLAAVPFTQYITSRSLGTEQIAGHNTTHFNIEIDVDDLIASPEMEQLLATTMATQGVVMEPTDLSGVNDMRLTLDPYIGVDDGRMWRLLLRVNINIDTPVMNAANQQEIQPVELTTNLSLDWEGYDENYTVEIPPDAVPFGVPNTPANP
jgi:hypothetical protein